MRDTAFKSTESPLPGTPVANQGCVVAVDDRREARRELVDTCVTNAWESSREYKERDPIVTSKLDRTNKITIPQTW